MAFKSVQGRGLRRRPAGGTGAFLQGLDHHRFGFWLFKPQAPENESPPNNRPVTVFSQKGWLVEMAWLSQKRGFEVKI